MRVFLTGDCHGCFDKLYRFQEEMSDLTKEDIVIVLGDFGGLWSGSASEQEALDRLNQLPFTLCFVDGNHENHDLLETFPVKMWNHGKIHEIRSHIYHLMRGQVFILAGRKVFTFGGGLSRDIVHGVLDPDDPKFPIQVKEMNEKGWFYRILGQSYWTQELPSEQEMQEGLKNLKKHDHTVDYVLTHCAPTDLERHILAFSHPKEPDRLNRYLQNIAERTTFQKWYMGHYHTDVTYRFFEAYPAQCVLERFVWLIDT